MKNNFSVVLMCTFSSVDIVEFCIIKGFDKFQVIKEKEIKVCRKNDTFSPHPKERTCP